MKLTGWGNYPSVDAEIYTPRTFQDVSRLLARQNSPDLIARGLGRSYGDSSLAPHLISTRHLADFVHFDPSTGALSCESGTSFATILSTYVPQGWFLPVTPGTKFISVGGAIASDVHGKNHHIEGSFCDHLQSFKIALGTGEILQCSREEHADLFHATCGGMGLTGIILEATFVLRRISSAFIDETILKARNLQECLELFEEYKDKTYSVAWVDSLATGRSLGRSRLILGEHSVQGDLGSGNARTYKLPFSLPGALLNRNSVKLLNNIYYRRLIGKKASRHAHYDPFFYPLDRIQDWNRIYGKKGFTQYQFVLPKNVGFTGVKGMLENIAKSGQTSFLSVLKIFGCENNNLLSFPMEGYTLTLDFKLDRNPFKLLNEFDRIVLDYGGRLYLTKDARMSEATFKQSYAKWEEFRNVRTRYGADKVFNSMQSIRLGI